MIFKLQTISLGLPPGLRISLAFALLVFSSTAWSANTNNPSPEKPCQFRVAFSISVLSEINPNNAIPGPANP